MRKTLLRCLREYKEEIVTKCNVSLRTSFLLNKYEVILYRKITFILNLICVLYFTILLIDKGMVVSN